jgi:hypothetical protein
MEDVKRALLTETTTGKIDEGRGPPAGLTLSEPRFKDNLEALILLTEGSSPAKRCVKSRNTLTAYYSFGDALSTGFGAMVE